ncbi:MAG: phosphatase PAP2 family protein [Ignavibacteria bacterium]
MRYSITLIALLIFVSSSISISSAQDSTIHLSTQLKTDPDNFDVRLFRSINNSRTKFKDAVIPVIDKTMMPVSIILPFGLFIYGRASDNAYEENTGFLHGMSVLTNTALTFSLKFLIKRPRPYVSLKNVYCKGAARHDKYSFPSGHTSYSFSTATMFTLRYPKYPQVYLPLYAWSFIVGYGRVYLGMHYPSDVLGGIAVGTLSSVLIYSLRSEILKFKNNIFNENKPDANIDSKSLGVIAGTFILSSAVNEFITPLFNHNKKHKLNFSLYPVMKSNSAGIGMDVRW